MTNKGHHSWVVGREGAGVGRGQLQTILHVRTQYSVEPGHPPPYLILLAKQKGKYI